MIKIYSNQGMYVFNILTSQFHAILLKLSSKHFKIYATGPFSVQLKISKQIIPLIT